MTEKRIERFTISVGNELLNRIDDYRFTNRLPNRTQAVISLMEAGLDSLLKSKLGEGNGGNSQSKPGVFAKSATGTGTHIVDVGKLAKVSYSDMKTYWDVKHDIGNYVVVKDFASIREPKYVCAGIGTDSTWYTRCNVKYLPRMPETEQFANALMFPVVGASMTPVFDDGDVALVWEQPEAADGDIGVFKSGNLLYLKKKDGKYLISLNSRALRDDGSQMFPPIKMDQTFEVVGVAIGKL